VCRPKHVEQLRNNGIISSTARLHLVGSFYEIFAHGYITQKQWRLLHVLIPIRVIISEYVHQMILSTTLFWVITQRLVVIYYRPFGTIHRSQLQGSRFLLDSLPLKMGPTGCPETSVRSCHYSLRNNPEERSSHMLHGRSLKSRIKWYCMRHCYSLLISDFFYIR